MFPFHPVSVDDLIHHYEHQLQHVAPFHRGPREETFVMPAHLAGQAGRQQQHRALLSLQARGILRSFRFIDGVPTPVVIATTGPTGL